MNHHDLLKFSMPASGLVAGVDEAGRGPLAGSVFAAAVILPKNYHLEGLADSKKLSEKKRQRLAAEIKDVALAYAIAEATVAEIETLNILQATLLAMQRALFALSVTPELAFIDGNRLPKELPCVAEAVIGGDATIAAISAASILAKTARDATMYALAERHPEYGFDQHKGYGTRAHLAAIERYGVLPEHRSSFAPIRRHLLLKKPFSTN